MKKRLFSILTIFGIGLSFCNAQSLSCSDSSNCFQFSGHVEGSRSLNWNHYLFIYSLSDSYNLVSSYNESASLSCEYYNVVGLNAGYLQFGVLRIYNNGEVSLTWGGPNFSVSNSYFPYFYVLGRYNTSYNGTFSFDYNCIITSDYLSYHLGSSSCPEPEPSTIDVLYNNENSSSTITCNGDNIIQINGLSSITSTNTRTPYFNINYRDEDNQLLTESYSKDILYLSGSLFKKTYTGDNDWILTIQGDNNNSSFSGYVPTFDVVFTGDTFNDTGNVFNNFAQNSLQVALSNIPSYIQYVIIIMLLFFILGLARRKKRR